VYENFYRAYNPAAADRLGIIYTPNEIVRFMVESADCLVHMNFGRLLGDEDVEILDPATGTGTFITEIIEHLPKNRLPYKYGNEIHCNEVAILPYYIANLNIEYTYSQKMGRYAEFKNICFVDTLDNLGFQYNSQSGKQTSLDLFGLTAVNLERIKRQNRRKISDIIGNPPYNANQLNENENNKNREYPGVDKRIKDTYVAESTAQKTKLYDMYSRFIRWASDRLDKNGVLAFITNRSLIDARTYDGFRKVVADEFSDIYVVDLGGDVRKNPKLSGPKHNVFAIQTGVAISFFVRNSRARKLSCRIFYTRRPEMETAKEKLQFLATTKFTELSFEHIHPDKNHNWIDLAENDWGKLLPVAAKSVKLARGKINDEAIFRLFSLGVITARDEWVYDFEEKTLEKKVKFLIKIYNHEMERLAGRIERNEVEENVDYAIKWTRAVKNDLASGIRYQFKNNLIVGCLYRPFIKKKLYFSHELNEMQYQLPSIFPFRKSENIAIALNVGDKPFNVLASRYLPDYHFNGDSQCLPLYRYDEDGNRCDNITDWAVRQFQTHYKDKSIARSDIFHYVYAVLHDPAYREKYKLNLKREFPRIPYYKDFRKWATRGARLMELHLDYEDAPLYPLKRIDRKRPKGDQSVIVKPLLKADKTTGTIQLDSLTTLKGVPAEAWEYRLGNRSAVEWVLEYHKERKPKDPTIREKFYTYRFADYKAQVVNLLQRVCSVSVGTMKIIDEMRQNP
ncbi:MAG: type ISP restriction/modification enzyme, partial [Syntrophales bacterium]|nr:type ISP restriction/modification enzyme [Syntrophales bacterium]